MSSGSFDFAGTSSASFGVAVELVPSLNRPARKQTIIEVPGRSGDIVFPEDAWSNVQQTYTVVRKATSSQPPAKQARLFVAWLQGVKGYQRLTDTFDTEVYRRAYVDGDIPIENIQNNVWRAQVTFNCRPERFLLTGETATTITTPGDTITSLVPYDSKPLIVVNGNSAGTLSIINGANTYTVSISAISSYIVLDCDEQDAYKSGTNLNDKVTITSGDSFPRLKLGTNTITWTGGITSVEITPRWFYL